MTPEQFWEDNPFNFEAYGKAYKLKQENKYKEIDIIAYSHGKYNLFAFAQVMANSFSKSSKDIFPKKPFSMQEENDENQTQNSMLKKFEIMATRWNEQFKKRQQKEGGE